MARRMKRPRLLWRSQQPARQSTAGHVPLTLSSVTDSRGQQRRRRLGLDDCDPYLQFESFDRSRSGVDRVDQIEAARDLAAGAVDVQDDGLHLGILQRGQQVRADTVVAGHAAVRAK